MTASRFSTSVASGLGLTRLRFKRSVLAAAGAATLGLSLHAPAQAQASGAPFQLKGKPKVAMILGGLRNDGGWQQAFDEARVKTEKAIGMPIQFVESVPEDASAIKPAVERFIQRGANIVIGTAFGYSDAFKELAEKYPHVAFLNGSGTTNGKNLQSFYGRTYESQYLCGMAAAAVSPTGKLGFVAANPFGVVNWTINAYAMGAQKVNPKATVSVIYTGAWSDPVKERAAASALLDQGVDVVGQHVDTPTPQIVAQERGKFGTGHHRDLSEFAPKATICSSVWVWDKFLSVEIQNIIAGKWNPTPAFSTIAQGGTDIPPKLGAAIPADKLALIQAERDAIVKGKHVYAGPVSDREGKVRVPAGQVISDADLWQMDWYVKGVITNTSSK